MRLLVLGGTEFVGRAVVDAALERGWEVTVFHRGRHPARRGALGGRPGARLRPRRVRPGPGPGRGGRAV
ncbi:NAD-dependent epimerase/dehydratase family protein, partial [Streptomyces sp. NPDC003362]